MAADVSAAEKVDRVRQVAQRIGGASIMMAKNEDRDIARFASSFQLLLESKSAILVETALRCESPILQVYMSDGWSCNTSTAQYLQIDQLKVRRTSREKTEFLAETMIMKCFDLCGKMVSALTLCPPRNLPGKTCWHIMGAAAAHPCLRLRCPKQLLVTVYLQDGLHAQAFGRRMRARHELFYDLDAGSVGELKEEQRCLDWVFSYRCILHICSSGLKWGLTPHCSEAILDDTHLSIKSARNSTSALVKFVRLHVQVHVRYQDATAPLAEREQFWQALGIHQEIIPLMLKVDPRWCAASSRLLVREHLEGALRAIDEIETVVEFLLHFRNWSDTRWGGIGPASRLFVGALCAGLEGLVPLVQRHGTNNDRLNLSAVRTKISPEVKKYMIIASLMSRPVEAVVFRMLKDDRFLLCAAECWKQMVSQSSYVEHLPDSVWICMSSMIGGLHFSRLRSETLQAMRASIAYVEREGYEPLHTLPLSLTQGCIDDNLAALRASESAGLDYISKRVQACSVAQPVLAKQGLVLLQQAPMSIGMVEKGHAAGAWVRRYHSCCGNEQLVERAYCNHARVLCRPSHLEREEKKLQHQLHELIQKASGPTSLQGWQLFASMHMRQTARLPVLPGQHVGIVSLQSMHKSWLRLSVEDQYFWQYEAAAVSQRRRPVKLGQAAALHAELADLHAKQASIDASGVDC